METLLIISGLIICYTYFGYGIIMKALAKVKKDRAVKKLEGTPELTVLIAAYNEQDCIKEKILNTMSLDYPQSKKHIWVVADGSDDNTVAYVKQFPTVKLLFQPERKGKIAAVNRAMELIKTPFTIMTDANTVLNKEALKNMVQHFADPNVAAVSGEKKVLQEQEEDAAASGEGLYWKYESMLKRLDAEVNSIVGAAGELIAIRTADFEKIPEDSVIEDFYMTMKFCQKGKRVAYEPKAFASEKASASVKEELKRKIRICAGAFQAIVRLSPLLNPFKYGLLSFQYISHRVLRWTLAPVALITLLIASASLAADSPFFKSTVALQVLFYVMAFVGYQLKSKKISFKVLHIPYYFTVMNYAVFAGFWRYLVGSQTTLWEKAARRS